MNVKHTFFNYFVRIAQRQLNYIHNKFLLHKSKTHFQFALWKGTIIHEN